MRVLVAAVFALALVAAACDGDTDAGDVGSRPTPGPHTSEPVATAPPLPTIVSGDGAAAFTLLQQATFPDESLPEELDGYILEPSADNATASWNGTPVPPAPGAVLAYSGTPADNGGVLLLLLVYPAADDAVAAYDAAEYAGAAGEIVDPAVMDATFDGAPGRCVSGTTAESRDLAVCAVQEGNVIVAATSAMHTFTEGRSNLVAAQELAELGLLHARLVLEQ